MYSRYSRSASSLNPALCSFQLKQMEPQLTYKI